MAGGTTEAADLDAVTDAVLTASRALVAVAARSLARHEGDVSIGQFRALVVLAGPEPLRPMDLANALAVDPSTVTRLCDRLERKGLISRRREQADRRQVELSLTAVGHELVDRVTRQRRAEIRRIVEGVPARDRGSLVRAFTAFNASAGERLVEDQPSRAWEL